MRWKKEVVTLYKTYELVALVGKLQGINPDLLHLALKQAHPSLYSTIMKEGADVLQQTLDRELVKKFKHHVPQEGYLSTGSYGAAIMLSGYEIHELLNCYNEGRTE